MARHRLVVVGALLALAGLSDLAAAKEVCDQRLLQQSSGVEKGYAARPGGRYCDGNIFVPNSGQLAIVSIVADAPPEQSPFKAAVLVGSNTTITVGWNEARIRGVSRSATGAYRFDGGVTAAAPSISIDAQSRLSELKLKPSEIGWTAWYTEDHGKRVMLPVSFGGASSGHLTFEVRPSSPTAGTTFTVRAGDQVIKEESKPGTKAGDIVSFEIPCGSPTTVQVSAVAVSSLGQLETVSVTLMRPER